MLRRMGPWWALQSPEPCLLKKTYVLRSLRTPVPWWCAASQSQCVMQPEQAGMQGRTVQHPSLSCLWSPPWLPSTPLPRAGGDSGGLLHSCRRADKGGCGWFHVHRPKARPCGGCTEHPLLCKGGGRRGIHGMFIVHASSTAWQTRSGMEGTPCLYQPVSVGLPTLS